MGVVFGPWDMRRGIIKVGESASSDCFGVDSSTNRSAGTRHCPNKYKTETEESQKGINRQTGPALR